MKANIAEDQPVEKNDSLVQEVKKLSQVQSVHPMPPNMPF
jgi:hypothetical protein